MNFKLISFLLLNILLAGCGYELKNAPQNIENVNGTGAQSNKTNSNVNTEANNSNGSDQESKSGHSKSESSGAEESKLVLNSTSETSTIPCNGREVEVDQTATANSYRLTGECKKLTVDGVSNKVDVEKVGEIVVKGISNQVTYGEGIGGKKPKITTGGTSTSVASAKSVQEKVDADKK